jgi:hypothetical protein
MSIPVTRWTILQNALAGMFSKGDRCHPIHDAHVALADFDSPCQSPNDVAASCPVRSVFWLFGQIL